MSPKPQPVFSRPKPPAPADVDAKLAELAERAEARGNAIAGQAPPVEQPQPEPPEQQVSEPANPQTRKLTHARNRKRERRESTGEVVRYGTNAKPYVRDDGQATRSTTLHLPVDLHQRLRMESAKRGEHMSALVAEAVREWFAKR